eukprot:3399018-Amphidinium_carterae.1
MDVPWSMQQSCAGDMDLVLQTAKERGAATRYAQNGEALQFTHFALKVIFISGTSRSITVSRGTSAYDVKESALPDLARRMQHLSSI